MLSLSADGMDINHQTPLPEEEMHPGTTLLLVLLLLQVWKELGVH
jgi:hypothetical protein